MKVYITKFIMLVNMTIWVVLFLNMLNVYLITAIHITLARVSLFQIQYPHALFQLAWLCFLRIVNKVESTSQLFIMDFLICISCNTMGLAVAIAYSL